MRFLILCSNLWFLLFIYIRTRTNELIPFDLAKLPKLGVDYIIKSPTDTLLSLLILPHLLLYNYFTKLVNSLTKFVKFLSIFFVFTHPSVAISSRAHVYARKRASFFHQISAALFLICFLCDSVHASAKFSIVWSTETHTESSNYLKDEDGQALDAGQALNGDGDLVELGYYSEGSFALPLQDNAFLGEWVPLTQNTRVGDSSSGYGFPNGMFAFRTTFTRDANYVTTYWGEPKYFVEYLDFPITASNPPPNTTPLCIRFYNSSTKDGGAKYNTVTGMNWRWPAFPSGNSIPTTQYFKIAEGNAPAGSFWSYGSTFEAPTHPFATSIAPTYDLNFTISPDSIGLGTIRINDQNSTFSFTGSEWGTEFTLTAIPASSHYEFMGWVGSGITGHQSATLHVDGDQTVYAQFFKVPYLLTLEVEGGGEVLGENSYSFGDVAEINASAYTGYSFSHWEKDGATYSLNPNETVSIDGDTHLVAVFTLKTYQVLIGQNEGGSYEIKDSNNSAPQSYKHGIEYTLRAIPSLHYGFESWEVPHGNPSMIENKNFAETPFIPTGDINITASFFPLKYQLNIESTQGYSSLAPDGNFSFSSRPQVWVVPKDGFVFQYWQDPLDILEFPEANETDDSKPNLRIANMSKVSPYESATVYAILRLDDYDDSDLNISSGEGGDIIFSSDNSGGFTHFTSYDLNATAQMGYEFDQWIGDTDQLEFGPFEKNNRFLIEGPLSLHASFSLSQYNLNLFANNDGFGSAGDVNGSSSITFTVEDNPIVQATAYPGYQFTHWSGDIDYIISHLASTTSIEFGNNSIPEDLNLTANFVPQIYPVSFNTEGNGTTDLLLSSGEVYYDNISAQLNVNSETQITFEALAKDGWTFSNWRGLPALDDLINPLASIDPYSFLIYFYPSAELNITAEFKVTQYDDSQIVLNTDIGGDVFLEAESSGKYLHFSAYDLNATPSKGYEFSGWSLDPPESNALVFGLGNPANQLNIIGEMEINASFSLIEYEIELTAAEGGTVSGPSSYTVNDSPLINATESPGWNFSHWSGDIEYLSSPLSSQSTINHTELVLQDLSLTANFEHESYLVSVFSEGTGTFDLSKDGIEFVSGSTNASTSVDSATRLGAIAQPSSGWKFSRWFSLPDPANLRDPSPSLDPFSSQIHFIPTLDTNITAKFERESYELAIVQPETGGTATGEGTFIFESVVDINASPQEHYSFQMWGGENSHLVYDLAEANNKLVIPDDNVSIYPIFQPKIYSVDYYTDGNGTFDIQGTYNEVTKINQNEYNATSSLIVSALPLDSDTHMLNYLYWENSLGDSGSSYSSTLNIPFLDANYSFWAFFTDRNEIGYSLIATPPYAGSAGQNTEYSSAQFQRLVANPNPGYSFIGWESKSGETFSPNWALHSVDSELQESSEIWAHFKPQSRFLDLQFDESQGEISGFSEEIPYGTNLSIIASADENYTFVNWELIKETTFEVERVQSSIQPAQSRLSINAEECPELSLIRGFTYHFDCNLSSGDEFFISTSADTTSTESYYLTGITGHLSSSGTLSFAVPLDAPDNLYYHASGSSYSGNRIKISSVADASLLASPANPVFSNRITHHFGLRANFERTRHSISLLASGMGTIDHEEQDIYFWGDEVEVSATPNEHWYFSHWEGSQHIENPNALQTILTVKEDSDIRAIFKKVPYQVDVNATPAEYGQANSPAETFTHGEYVTLTANPNIGIQFDEWISLENLSLDNPADRFNQTASFKVLGDAKAEATFSRIVINLDLQLLSLDINNQAIPGDVGASITKPDIIYHGDTVTIDLNPFAGYNFLYWVDLDSGQIISSQKSFTGSFTSDKNFQAVFRKEYYQLNILDHIGGTFEINSTAPFYWGDKINLVAVPNDHWQFLRWTGVGSEHLDNNNSSSTTLTIQKDSSISAEFKPKEYNLGISVSPSGYGVYSSVDETYNFGDLVEILATPRSGKLFHSWSINTNLSLANGYSSTTNPAQFFVSGDAELTANFVSKQYTVSYQVVVVDDFGATVEEAYGGRILGGENFYDEDIAEFAISLANGYKLKYWRDEAEPTTQLSTEKVYKHTMLSDLNLTAVVTERKYEVDLKISPSNGGSALVNNYYVSESFNQDDFAYGSEITLSANPNENYRFVKWDATGVSLASPSQADQSFNLGNDIKITAYFAPEGLVNLSLVSEPADAASYLFGGGSFAYNPDHAILAMPKQGYLFSHWDYNGSVAIGIVQDPYSPTTSVALDADKQLSAVFVIDESAPPPNEESNQKYLLSVFSDNISQGTTSGSGFFSGVRTIKAYPKDGFEFSHWDGGTFSDPYDSTTQVNVFETTTVVAHFQSVGVFEDSESLENGWWGNPWFGYFWKIGEGDWLFHEKLGWIFMKKKGDESIWVWIQKMEDWFWTAKEHYPYLHSSSTQSWFFVNLENSNFLTLIIFDYEASKWLSK